MESLRGMNGVVASSSTGWGWRVSCWSWQRRNTSGCSIELGENQVVLVLLSAAAGCSESSLVAAGCSMAQRENYLLETNWSQLWRLQKGKKKNLGAS